MWEADGIRLLEHLFQPNKIQLTFSATPSVDPVYLAGRAKGRLIHGLRKSGCQFGFSRKLSIRTLGNNTRVAVENYIRAQVANEQFVDSERASIMRQFTYADPVVDLANATNSARGRYWYNLHLVLVVAKRHRVFDSSLLQEIYDGCLRISRAKSYTISTMSVMPDHLHLALRGRIDHSPMDIALAFQNNLAFMLGQSPIWEAGFYAGTFGEYSMRAVRT